MPRWASQTGPVGCSAAARSSFVPSMISSICLGVGPSQLRLASMYDVNAPSAELTCWRQAPTNWPCAAGDGEPVGVAGAAVGVDVGVAAGVGVGAGEQAPRTATATPAATDLMLGMPPKGSE